MYDSGVDSVVVNYRTPLDLETFCRSFRDNAFGSLTIVNNAPKEQDDQIASDWASKAQAQVITHEENVGYAIAVNDAVSRGTNEIIAIFNADVEILPDSFQRCVDGLQQHPSWGVLGPRQINEDKRLTHGGIFGSNDAPRFRGWLCPDGPSYADVRSAVTISGAALFVKRQVWDELTSCSLYRKVAPDSLGAFLPTPLYYEETACNYHARAHGYEVIYYGPALMVHKWHRSVKLNHQEAWARECLHISQQLFRNFCDVHGIVRD